MWIILNHDLWDRVAEPKSSLLAPQQRKTTGDIFRPPQVVLVSDAKKGLFFWLKNTSNYGSHQNLVASSLKINLMFSTAPSHPVPTGSLVDTEMPRVKFGKITSPTSPT